ncbi:MAG: bifunctional aldolase/short-chain dehydrogenase [Chloroflexi bacterium]|nr:bifunctional aldolase/short-chain dehydrogenase [Chloroflexota bacterium]
MPQNLWDPQEANHLLNLDGLVYRSRLSGRDNASLYRFEGSTSARLNRTDHMGRDTRLLAVKACGPEQTAITESDFALLRLDEIEPLFERETMTDAEVVVYLSRTVFEPGRPRPGLETLLHAFIPHPHIDYTRPDAILSLACAPDAERLVSAVYGTRLAFVPYQRPGFALGQLVGRLMRQNPSLEGFILGKNGLLTWGDDARTCYEKTIAIIQEAETYVQARRGGIQVFGAPRFPAISAAERQEILTQTLPVLRGALSGGSGVILSYDDSEAALELASGAAAATIGRQGAPCPEYAKHLRRLPLCVDWKPADGLPALHQKLRDGLSDPAPRIVIIPGLGLVCAGTDARSADQNCRLFRQTINIMGGSLALGGFEGLTETEALDLEHETRPTPTGELEGRVALITGGTSGIGQAAAYRLAQDGAHVVILGRSRERGEAIAADINRRHGHRRALMIEADMRDEAAVEAAFRQTVLTCGGLDILVNNAGSAGGAPVEDTTLEMWQHNLDVLATGYFLAARAAFRVMKAQGTGGAMVFVASKNSIAAGKGAAAYSAAKAAEVHLARCLAEEGGAYGIRVNSVLPDAVIRGSGIWDSAWKEARARQYGIAVDDLYEFYRKRNTLKVEILPEDIAEAIVFLAGPRSAKTTAAILTVDGGVPTAYVR